MRPVILLLSVVLIFQTTIYGQSLAVNLANKPLTGHYHLQNEDEDMSREKIMCTTTKVGLISMGVGMVTFIVGVKMSDDYTRNLAPHDPGGNDQGIVVYLAGILVFGIGSGLAIGGGIHDIVKHYRQRVTLISPKRNQIGLAYNF
jgi:hypothetical protein